MGSGILIRVWISGIVIRGVKIAKIIIEIYYTYIESNISTYNMKSNHKLSI